MFDLPEMDEAAAAAAAILAPRLPYRLTVAGFELEAGFPRRGMAGPPPGWPRISGRIDGHGIVLEAGPALLPAAALSALPDLPAIGMPEALRALLVDLLLADLSDAAEAAGGARPEWEAAATPGPLPHRLLLAAAAPPGDLLAVLHLSDGALAWLARRAAVLPACDNDLGSLPMRVTMLLDRLMLAESDLRDLSPGDVVLLQRDPAGPDGTLAAMLVPPGGPGFRAGLNGSRLELLSDLDVSMTDPDSPSPSIDGLRLPVEVTLGTLELPLARLGTLAVGDVLDLGLDATAQVVLRVNGQAVADGELVRIAGRTGVRILDVRLTRGAP